MPTNPHIVKALVDLALLLEFSDDSEIEQDTAVAALEQLAAELQQMDEASKRELVQEIVALGGRYQDAAREFVESLPESLGLI